MLAQPPFSLTHSEIVGVKNDKDNALMMYFKYEIKIILTKKNLIYMYMDFPYGNTKDKIYDVPMKFVNKLIHGGQCNFVIDLFHTVNQWQRYTGLTN